MLSTLSFILFLLNNDHIIIRLSLDLPYVFLVRVQIAHNYLLIYKWILKSARFKPNVEMSPLLSLFLYILPLSFPIFILLSRSKQYFYYYTNIEWSFISCNFINKKLLLSNTLIFFALFSLKTLIDLTHWM